MKRIFPDMNIHSESLSETAEQVVSQAQKNQKPVVPESVKAPVQKDDDSAIAQNVESVGVPNEETSIKRTYEDKFMEEVQNLGTTRQRKAKPIPR